MHVFLGSFWLIVAETSLNIIFLLGLHIVNNVKGYQAILPYQMQVVRGNLFSDLFSALNDGSHYGHS